MTAQKALHPRYVVDSLYVKEYRGRGLNSIEDSVDALIKWLEDYIEKHGGRRITVTRDITDNTKINKTKMS